MIKRWIRLPVMLVATVASVIGLSFLFQGGPDPVEPGAGSGAGPAGKKLRIVGEVWPPFEYLDRQGRLTGINVQVFERVFARLEVPYELKLYPWVRAEMMAKNGQADAVVSVSYKRSREDFLSYTDSQKEFGRSGKWPGDFLWRSDYVFFCRRLTANSLRFESYGQIAKSGYRVGLVRAYSYSPEFRNSGLGNHTAPDIMTGFKLLDGGKYDLFPADRTIGQASLARLGLAERITYLPKVMFSKPYLLVMCRQSSWPDKERVIADFYVELARLRASGEYDRICEGFFRK